MGVEDIRQAWENAEDLLPGAGIGAPDGPGFDPEDPRPAECALFPLNDYGNGCRFLAYFGEDVLFVPRVGWFRWTGQVWRQDENRLEVRALAQSVAARILEEIPHVALEEWQLAQIAAALEVADEFRELERIASSKRSPEQAARHAELKRVTDAGEAVRKALGAMKRSHRDFARTSGNSGKIDNMLTEAQVGAAIELERLDADPLAINTASGVIRFAEVEDQLAASFGQPAAKVWVRTIEDHARGQYLSKLIPVDLDPGATCPNFMAFLERIQPSAEIREFLQRWFGYSMTALTVEQKFAFFFGGGRNGKSTLVDLIAKIMGDYSATIPIESLTGDAQRKGSEATPDLLCLPGARMVRSSEPEQGQKFREAMIKLLTGGEPINVRRMHQEMITVEIAAKFTVSGNSKPAIHGGDDGIWRRILLVPFDEQIPKEEVDPMLPRKLWEERAGVLNWLLEGLEKYLAHGLGEPEAVLSATKQYRETSDPFGAFLRDECEVTGAGEDWTSSKDLIDAFRIWQEAEGDEPFGKRTVSRRIKDRSEIYKDAVTGARFSYLKRSDSGYVGIRLGGRLKGMLAHDRFSGEGF
jgi:putative DNA primase/helicase